MTDMHAADVTKVFRRPNFLIIGAAKSGTTSLWHYLDQHPQVYMSPRKHTRFFSFTEANPSFCGPPLEREATPYAVVDHSDYHELFAGAKDEVAVGEASHSYMYQPIAARRIKDYDPDMKLVAVLRHPAERAFSHYQQMIRDGREDIPDFLQALKIEPLRIEKRWWPDFHYVRIGLYHEQLARYYELFDPGRIKVYLYEDLSGNPLEVVRDLFGFLGVDEDFVPETSLRYNASGIPKSRFLHTLLQEARTLAPVVKTLLPERQTRRLMRLGSALHNRNLTRPRLELEVRRLVTERYFRRDILLLQELIDRDLSSWLA